MLQTLVLILAFMASTTVLYAAAPKVGDAVPDVGAPDETGKEVKLSSFAGKSGVIVFFYPKAFTPGCTKEVCNFRDEGKTIETKGYAVLGVSRDTPEKQKEFKEKYELKYPLLSDPDGKLAQALGIEPGKRQTVVIGKDGKIERVYAEVAAATHAADLMKDLAK
jgi:peroxiredoxin Q/BCP